MDIGKQNSLAIIVAYLGSLPWYYKYFIHTCKYNPTVDFFLLLDQPVDKSLLPVNVKVIVKNFDEINALFSQGLNMPIKMEFAYKLCDYRPAFGVIFEDLLKNYNFWGYSDFDVIFGNIRNFVTYDLMSNFDIISMRHDYLPGCFTVYKNCDKVNTLFTHSKDYVTVFSNATHFCFDETNFCHEQFTDGVHYSKIHSQVESMTHVVKKLQESGDVRAYFDFQIIEGRPGRLKWQNGTLIYKNTFEVLLYHLIKLKEVYTPNYSNRNINNTFYISSNSIYF